MLLQDTTVMDDMMITEGVTMTTMEVMTNMGWRNSSPMICTMTTDMDMTTTDITKNFDKDPFFSIL